MGKRLTFLQQKHRFNYFAGRVEQVFLINGLEIEQILVFSDKRTAKILTKIKNLEKSKTIKIGVKGKLFENLKAGISTEGKNIIVGLNTKENILVQKVEKSKKITVNSAEKSYLIDLGTQVLKPQKEFQFVTTQSYYLTTAEYKTHKNSKVNFESILAANKNRWNGYFDNFFSKYNANFYQENYMKLAVKAIVTLNTNWRSAARDIHYAGTFPSVSTFQGLWAWDNWKHAVALASFRPELAKDNIKNLV